MLPFKRDKPYYSARSLGLISFHVLSAIVSILYHTGILTKEYRNVKLWVAALRLVENRELISLKEVVCFLQFSPEIRLFGLENPSNFPLVFLFVFLLIQAT